MRSNLLDRIDRIHGAIRPLIFSVAATTIIMTSVPTGYHQLDLRDKQQFIKSFRRAGRKTIKKLLTYASND